MEGWNDPPKNVGMPTGNLKINLNKRVAFPLSSSTTAQNSGSAQPLLLPPKPPTCQASVGGTEQNLVTDILLDSQQGKVLDILKKSIEELSSTVQPAVESKLKTLEDDWSNLDPEIQRLLVELSQYLESKDTKSAATTQRKLVMKGCCKPWLHAIRQIIMNMETVSSEEPQAPSIDPIPQLVLPTNE